MPDEKTPNLFEEEKKSIFFQRDPCTFNPGGGPFKSLY